MIIRWMINYIKSCSCDHEWELIFDEKWTELMVGNRSCKVYRCRKCGYSKRYKC